jgi:hypothetical protein
MNSPKTSLPKLPATLQGLVKGIKLQSGESFSWSPKNKAVTYIASRLSEETGQWSLLHEIAHAHLGHQTFETDFELLQLELAAWEQAKVLAGTAGITIEANYIEDCLDTYRDWLHQRSTCPTCGNSGLQHSSREYRCYNCMSTWHVSQSRFCRPYRMKQVSGQNKKSSDQNQTTFQ